MISFACKQIDIREIVMCSFDINKTEYAILHHLLESNEEMSVGELGKQLKLERSTVQKAIKTLFQTQLVERRQYNLSSGGYHFHYHIKARDKLKEQLKSIVEEWHNNVLKEIQTW